MRVERGWIGVCTMGESFGRVRFALFGLLTVLAINVPMTGPATANDEAGFQRWVSEFRAEAVAQGVPAALYDEAFQGVRLNPKIVELDGRQPEFVTPLWEYLDRAVSDQRIANGRAKRVEYAQTLEAISARYGVAPEVLTAFWGIESNFGSNRGSFNVIEALATLGYDGRRERFGRTQLIEALKILKNGDTTPDKLVGSWAGAMGHTQFIPTSYAAYAADFNGDGRRDIWAEDPTDALASTANYLVEFGWNGEEPWGFHVALPPSFDYSVADGPKFTTAAWADRGLVLANGGDLPRGFSDAQLITPAGAGGPAFLALNNFRVIMRYNNATSYALAVSLLSERIDGRPARTFAWPEGVRLLKRDEREELQRGLTQLGFDTGGVDGVLGRNTRAAIRLFQKTHGIAPDGYATADLLEKVRARLRGEDINRPVTRSEVREMQTLLTNLGFDTQGVDGIPGRRTRSAISQFQKSRGVLADGEPTITLLGALRLADRAQ
ncbi:MAG: lytic murein transglycosylase [Pseudomonadota bacterium]